MSDEVWTDKQYFVQRVASILDYPSVYMGGASKQNQRNAEAIWKQLLSDGWRIERKDGNTERDIRG